MFKERIKNNTKLTNAVPFVRTSLSQGQINLRIMQGLQSEISSCVLFQTLFTDVYKIYHSNNCEFSYPKPLTEGVMQM